MALQNFQGLLLMGERQLRLSPGGMNQSDIVEAQGDLVFSTVPPVDLQRPLVERQGFVISSPGPIHFAHIARTDGDALISAEFLIQRQSILVCFQGPVKLPPGAIDLSQVVIHRGQAVPILHFFVYPQGHFQVFHGSIVLPPGPVHFSYVVVQSAGSLVFAYESQSLFVVFEGFVELSPPLINLAMVAQLSGYFQGQLELLAESQGLFNKFQGCFQLSHIHVDNTDVVVQGRQLHPFA